jgi:predicted AAA+ superfamily ATPase
MFNRYVNLPIKESFFLFGARGTGKSTLLNNAFAPSSCALIDLLLPEVEQAYSLDPSRLRSFVHALPAEIAIVIIDEIQKVPALLDVVH